MGTWGTRTRGVGEHWEREAGERNILKVKCESVNIAGTREVISGN